jgi:hypothetical protein
VLETVGDALENMHLALYNESAAVAAKFAPSLPAVIFERGAQLGPRVTFTGPDWTTLSAWLNEYRTAPNQRFLLVRSEQIDAAVR